MKWSIVRLHLRREDKVLPIAWEPSQQRTAFRVRRGLGITAALSPGLGEKAKHCPLSIVYLSQNYGIFLGKARSAFPLALPSGRSSRGR